MNQQGKLSLRVGALVGALSSLPAMALLYLGEQLAGVPFVPFELFDWLARVLPGDIVTFGIDLIVGLVTTLGLGDTSESSKSIEQILALLVFIFLGLLMGLLVAWLASRRPEVGVMNGALVGLVSYFFVILVQLALGTGNLIGSVIWQGLVFVSWGFFLAAFLAFLRQIDADDEGDMARRAAIRKLLWASAGISLGALGLGRLFSVPPRSVGADLPPERPTANPIASTAAPPVAEVGSPTNPTAVVTTRDRTSPAPGTRQELTPTADFYRIDINLRPPVLSEDSWSLRVDGLFDNPRDLSLADLMAFPSFTQPITLSCISNRVGGDLIGNAYWTGARLRDVLADLGLQPEAQELFVESSDGFFESVIMADMMDPRTMLVYGMNDEILTADHGFPLRILIPNRYGMKQPKWITRIEAVGEEGSGYWVVRGWSREARPHIVSVIDSVAADQPTADGLIPIGGIAWAGDRGIQKVELQIDDGQWIEAVLRAPPLGPLTWIQWRYDWPATSGRHEIRVRATDGNGSLQIEEEQGVRPNGATGYHVFRVRL